MKIGNINISNLKLGTVQIKKVFIGLDLVWTSFLSIINDFKARVLSSQGEFEGETCLNDTLEDMGIDLFDQASLVITPNGYKENVLFSVTPSPVGTNLFLRSSEFENSIWYKNLITISSTYSTAPNTLLEARTVKTGIDASASRHRLSQSLNSFVNTNATYTFSIYAKKNQHIWIQLNFVVGFDINNWANFDLENGVIGNTGTGATATIQNVGSGWYRLSIVGTPIAAQANYSAEVIVINNTNSGRYPSYQSTVAENVFDVWGAQLEIGTTAGAYIPTSTRQAINETICDLSFTRATLAYRINQDKLVEPSPYNLFSWSEDFSNSLWNKNNLTITTNIAIAPDGNNTADLYVPNTTTGEHQFNQALTSTGAAILVTPTNEYNWTIYVKSAGNDYFLLRARLGGIWYQNTYNLSTGTVVASPNFISADIEDVGDGWYRLSCVFTNVDSPNTMQFVSTPNGSAGFTGDGVSGAYIWGAQLTLGAVKRDYFPTTNRFNVPVLDYTNSNCPSILTEPQATNFMLNTTTLTNTWLFSSAHQITNDLFILGSGKNLKNLINDNINSNSNSMCIKTNGLTNIIKSGSNSLSFFIKKTSTHNSISVWGFVLSGGTGTGSYNINFNVDTLSVSYPQTSTRFTNRVGGVIPIGNNIYYCYERFTSDANYSITLGFSPTTSGTNQMLIGQEMSIGGFQMEQTTYPTSYIPTGTSSVTRNGTTITKTGIKDLIGQTEGTILIKGIQTARGVIFRLRGTTTANSVSVFNTGDNIGRCEYIITKNGATISTASASAPNNQFNKNIIIRYTQTNMQVYLNGVLFFNYNYPASTDFTSILDRIEFGSLTEVGLARFNLIAIWKTPLTSQQAINLTTL